MTGSMLGRKKYEKKNRDIDMNNDTMTCKQNPFLPFQNAAITNRYHIVPAMKDSNLIGLTIESISNPNNARR